MPNPTVRGFFSSPFLVFSHLPPLDPFLLCMVLPSSLFGSAWTVPPFQIRSLHGFRDIVPRRSFFLPFMLFSFSFRSLWCLAAGCLLVRAFQTPQSRPFVWALLCHLCSAALFVFRSFVYPRPLFSMPFAAGFLLFLPPFPPISPMALFHPLSSSFFS